MPRKPIQFELRGLQTPRERTWRAVMASPAPFTRMSVQDLCSPMVEMCLVADYLDALERAGYLMRVGGGVLMGERGCKRTEYEYRLTSRPAEAPRLTQQGKPVTQGLATTAMWRAMKVLKTFNFHDLAKAATLGDFIVPPIAAKKYLLALAHAGYLQQVHKSKPGTAAVWRLVKNTGPHAPAVTRLKAVFDRNTGKFSTLQTAQEICDAIDA